MNLNACNECGEIGIPKEANREKSGGDGVDSAEKIEYEHQCGSCSHVIATHEFTFEVSHEDFEEGMQVYTMDWSVLLLFLSSLYVCIYIRHMQLI